MSYDLEQNWDKVLRIKTSGRDDTNATQYYYPYEPTPYSVLERLAKSGFIGKKNTVIDYGCGKGRVDFFLSYQTKCHSIGIEYDERIYQKALENQKSAASNNRTEFTMICAEGYEVPETADRFYFFNPFSVDILKKVLARIKESYYIQPRKMYLFFYYPSDEYMGWLMMERELLFVDEIDCSDLFSGENPRERIVVFSLEG